MKAEKDTRNNILKAAESVFLQLGYDKSGLRTICEKAGVTTGAFYFFFDNKKALFRELVENTAKEFLAFIRQAVETEFAEGRRLAESNGKLDGRLDWENEKAIMTYLYDHRNTFLLLMTRAAGSEYEDFADQLRQQSQAAFAESIRIYRKEPMAEKQVRQLAQLISSFRMNSYMELLQSDLSLAEILEQAKLISRYAIAGWNEIMQHEE